MHCLALPKRGCISALKHRGHWKKLRSIYTGRAHTSSNLDPQVGDNVSTSESPLIRQEFAQVRRNLMPMDKNASTMKECEYDYLEQQQLPCVGLSKRRDWVWRMLADLLLKVSDTSMFVLQDRIGRDGSLISGNLPTRHASVPEHTRRPPSLPLTAPLLPPISDHQLQELVDFVTGNRCCLSDGCCPVSVKISISSICQSCPCCAFCCACGQSLQSWHALFYGPASRIPGPYRMGKLCWTLMCTWVRPLLRAQSSMLHIQSL